ncbi:MAG: class I SAM-dependent methyltransferase [Elusimicrobiota bacterium]
MNCILCHSKKIIKVDFIDRKDLIRLWFKLIKKDLSYLISDDIILYECMDCRLRFYYPVVGGDEEFYNSLQRFEWYYMDDKEEYRYSAKYVNLQDTVLEIGCGRGAFIQYIRPKKYIGIELNKKAINTGREKGIDIREESIEEFSKKNVENFNIVVCFQVLEHVFNPRSFLESALKTLKQNGLLIISVPSEDSFLKFSTNEIMNLPPHHITRWSVHSLKSIASNFNLELKDIYHENLQAIHKNLYLQTLVTNSILTPKLLDINFKRSIVTKLASLVAKVLAKGLVKEMLPKGHTIVAVYKKG